MPSTPEVQRYNGGHLVSQTCRQAVGPDEDVLEEVDLGQLVDAEHGFRMDLSGHVSERQRRPVAVDEWDIGGRSCVWNWLWIIMWNVIDIRIAIHEDHTDDD